MTVNEEKYRGVIYQTNSVKVHFCLYNLMGLPELRGNLKKSAFHFITLSLLNVILSHQAFITSHSGRLVLIVDVRV